ncbi:SE1832 family protein, partial [Staphylococcus arlettae]
LNSKLAELKDDYIRLQNDLDKRESVNQDTDPLHRQLAQIENEIADIRSKMRQKESE